MGMTALSGIDYLMMILYLVFTIGLGMYLGKNIRTGKDYFLAGRKLPWWAIGMSMVVSDIGAIDIVGIAGAAYLYGIVMGNYDWIGCIPVMIICGFVFIPYFWRSKVYTIPEFLGKRFNLGVRTICALIWGVFLACNLGIMLYATAVMMNTMLGFDPQASVTILGCDISYTALMIVVSAVMIGLYTLVGGLTAVVYTDVLQCVVMMLGCTFTLFIGLYKCGGISGLTEAVFSLGDQYKDHFKLVLPVDTETPQPWPGILLGLGMVLAPAYWFGNQAIVQRCLGARSEFEAKAAFMWGALLKTFIPFIMVVPGIIALAHNPNVVEADSALPALIRDILPTGILGIFFAAFLAALMSSVDSCLNSAATLWTKDIYERFIHPDGDEKHYLIVGRILTVVFVVFGTWFAIWVPGRSASIYNIIQTMLAIFQGPSLVLIIMGVLWWRTTGIAAIVGLIAGLLVSTTLLLTHEYASTPLFQTEDPFLYIAMWSFIVSLVLTIVVSLLTKPEPDEKLVGFVYRYKGRNNHATNG